MISVVICTYNRADLLPDLLASLAHQNAPDVPIEILFVDNNSRDNTSALLQAQIGTLPFPPASCRKADRDCPMPATGAGRRRSIRMSSSWTMMPVLT